jgi:hypothetical protein
MLYIVSTPTATVLHFAVDHPIIGWREYQTSFADLSEARSHAWAMAQAFASIDAAIMLPFWEYSA